MRAERASKSPPRALCGYNELMCYVQGGFRRAMMQGLLAVILAVAVAVVAHQGVATGVTANKLPPPQPLHPQAPQWQIGPLSIGQLQIYSSTVSLPTFPYERYQSDGFDPQYNWHYKRFDYERFRNEAPSPEPRTYKTIVLENEYLRLILLPEVGGRLWRVIQKSTGDDLFYHNPVVMPSPWGPEQMQGWFALGGLEWGLPVAEHGYAWGTPWEVTALENDGQQAAVTLTLPQNDQTLGASIKIGLAAAEAAFTVTPAITNVSKQPVRFAFWHSAALAPGKANTPSAETRFIIPSAKVAVHSTADSTLPRTGHTFAWPEIGGRDLSRLGNWDQYLGFFEWPAAHGPFVAVYDPVQDAGVVRLFPNASVRGSKVFGLGWQNPLDSSYYTTDGSSYVELHGGLAPTFADQVALAAGDTLTWSETWYPVSGIGGIKSASEQGALTWQRSGNGVCVGFYPTHRFAGDLVISAGAHEMERTAVTAQPDAPFAACLPFTGQVRMPDDAQLTVQMIDSHDVSLAAK